MSGSFGREIGLVHQVIMNSARLGGDERFWKSLVQNEELLASMIDAAMFFNPPNRISCFDATGQLRNISLLCFSQKIWVRHDEATLRVQRFGRFASDEEIEMLCGKLQELWDAADCLPLQYPIIAFAEEDTKRHPEYFLAIVGAGENGRPTLAKCNTQKQMYWDGNFSWAPCSLCAAVAGAAFEPVLRSRGR